MACQRWWVTKLCVKDGVVKDGVVKNGVVKNGVCVCDEVVCEGWCVKDGVRQSCM